MFNKRQDIRWKEAVGGNQYSGNIEQKKMSIVTSTLLTTTCMLFFMLSSRIMFKDVFAWGDFSGGWVAIAYILLTVVCGIMEMSYHLSQRKGLMIRFAVLIAGIVVALLYMWMDSEGELSLGFAQISEQYMYYWNRYFGFNVGELPVEVGNVKVALNFSFLVLTFLFLWISRMCKKNIIMLALPILVLSMELLVGKSPDELGVFFLFIGVILANACGFTKSDFVHSLSRRRNQMGVLKYFMWVAVGIGAILFYCVVKVIGSDSADEMAANGRAFREFQEELVADITNWSIWDIFSDNSDSGIIDGDWGIDDSYKDKLSNKPLKYKNRVILELEIDNRIYSNIYIRGYYANIYQDGVWELDTTEFEKLCEEHGADAVAIGYDILYLAASKLEASYPIDERLMYSGSIRYMEKGGERAFFPYFINIDGDEDVYAEGEARYKKGKSADSLSFRMWNKEPFYEYYLSKFEYEDKYDWEYWYEDYVLEHYTQLSKDIPIVEEIADYVTNEISSNSYSYNNENEVRLAMAETVAKWLEQYTTYTQEPPALPSGVDPVEYFLNESRKGYCMHYASSAVLILRELGVPARYATGYVVDPSLYKMVDSVYVAKVLDNRAHAWVEIYMDGMGWVPIEVTKGYYTTNIEHLGDNNENNTSEDIDGEDVSEENTTQPEEETSSEETTTLPEENSSDNNSTEGIDEGFGYDGTEGNGGSSSGGGEFKVVGICVILVAMSAGAVYVIMQNRKAYNERLLGEIRRKRTVRAIRNINRRIYRKVRVDAKIFKNNLRDTEYAEVLKKTYTDITEKEWGRFMVVVKAATFSDIELAEKEMDFCYDVYKRVMKKEINS